LKVISEETYFIIQTRTHHIIFISRVWKLGELNDFVSLTRENMSDVGNASVSVPYIWVVSIVGIHNLSHFVSKSAHAHGPEYASPDLYHELRQVFI
jgi:hypothetical protein